MEQHHHHDEARVSDEELGVNDQNYVDKRQI